MCVHVHAAVCACARACVCVCVCVCVQCPGGSFLIFAAARSVPILKSNREVSVEAEEP